MALNTSRSVIVTVFALGLAASNIITAQQTIAASTRFTLAVTDVLVLALAIVAWRCAHTARLGFGAICEVGLLFWSCVAYGQTQVSARDAPTSADSYLLNAAGGTSEGRNGLSLIHCAEDWTGMRVAGKAHPLKAMPLRHESYLTLGTEVRVRIVTNDNAQLTRGNDYEQANFRGTFGADLRCNPDLRIYSEVGTGQVEGRRSAASANCQNDSSLQQLLVEVRRYVGSTLLGAIIGGQEFADGPTQLISLNDGPNIHRTWNGVRFYSRARRFRVVAFDMRATRLKCGFFDDGINHAELLYGFNGSLIMSSGKELNTYVDPLWIHTENPEFASAGHVGRDNRDTFGARLWGRQGDLQVDWTLVHQTGRCLGRDIDAWGLFAVQSIALSDHGWRPRLKTHIDVASGGAYGTGNSRAFNPLYANTNYLSEGSFLSLSNLLLFAPGISVLPTPPTKFSIEYAFAQRLRQDDAVYAGQMRAYPGTQNTHGYGIGGLLRLGATWAVSGHLSLSLTIEHLDAGDVLKQARLASGSYSYFGATYRY